MSRRDRRAKQAKIRHVQAHRDGLLRDKAAVDLKLAALQKQILEHHESLADGMEELVDVLAGCAYELQSEHLGTREMAKKQLDDVPAGIFDSLVSNEWRGVKTLEEAHDALAVAVSERLDLRIAILFVLTYIDRIALGEVVPFGDDAQVSLFQTLLACRWHGSTSETILDMISEQAHARKAHMRAHGIGDVIHGSVHASRGEQAKRTAEELFEKRMDEELRLLGVGVRKQWSAKVADAKRALDRGDRVIEQIDRLKLHDDTEVVLEGTAAELDEFKARVLPPATISKAPVNFDRDVMLWGKKIWEHTYAKGADDASARKFAQGWVSQISREQERPDLETLLTFSALWAVHAFQRITTSHTFGAALMCSDANRESLETIETQWRAFLVILPDGLLTYDGRKVSRITVAIYDDRAEMMLVDANPAPGTTMTGVAESASTLADLLLGELDQKDATSRALVMAKRLVAGLLLSLQHQNNFKTKDVPYRAGRPGRHEEEPAHRVVIVGRPLNVDCRESVRNYIASGPTKRSGKHVPPSVQVLVRGHYKRQVIGVGRGGRKVIWIEPYWRGPEDAPILMHPTHAGPRAPS